MDYFLIAMDVPGIKQFVFGTDPLQEIRGASAQLVGVNESLQAWLEAELGRLGGGRVQVVYSNGGAGQFLVSDVSGDEGRVRASCDGVCATVRHRTGGQARLAYGVAALADPLDGQQYRGAVQAAQWRLRLLRETDFCHRVVRTWPLVRECDSSSALPAQHHSANDGEPSFLSSASRKKRDQSGRQGAWNRWMDRLARSAPSWPPEDDWERLRCNDFNELAGGGAEKSTLAVIYADGNAMGKLVPQLDSMAAYSAFSQIVDASIHEACYAALREVCRAEIEQILEKSADAKLPADILLLGGDDLVAALPGDRALVFAERVVQIFSEETRRRLAALPDAPRAFFDRLGVGEFTISCGVAVAPAKYPFVLLLELAEELMANAKRGGSEDPESREYWAPGYIDFHQITASGSHRLNEVRRRDYFVDPKQGARVPRTVRPYRLERLAKLRQAVARLKETDQALPRSKLHALYAAALNAPPAKAQRAVRDLFVRCTESQRLALWDALRLVADSGEIDTFPWVATAGGGRALPIPDLVEAFDLYGSCAVLGTARG